MTDLLTDALAELYGLDPDEFTARRAQLAAQARAADEPVVASQIGMLRKPTVSAWMVNQLVRDDPGVMSRLTGLYDELRAAQQSPDAATIRELTAARGQLIDELTRQALAASGRPSPTAALREEVAATIGAAISDPEVAANLGTLVRAARWAGFGLAADLAPAPAPARAKAPAKAGARPAAEAAPRGEKPTPARPGAEPAVDPSADELARRRQEKISSAERAVAEADQALEAVNAAEQRLDDEVKGLEARLELARQQLSELRREAYRAESRQRKAAEQLARLQSASRPPLGR